MLETKRLYQLFVARLNGEQISDASYIKHIVSLVKNGLGGVIVFGGELNAVKGFIAELQAMAEVPLFVCADTERGLGQQLQGASTLAGAMATASAIDLDKPDDVELLRASLNAFADELLYAGINMPLIPVLDVNTNPDNPIICTRAFSDDPKVVAGFGSLYVKILQARGLICCGKHFPGHGDTVVDSHIELPIINKTLTDLEVDLFPFKSVAKIPVKSLMLAHIVATALDDTPASLSKKIINMLKDTYDGLLITDALNMSALKNYRALEASCLNAGVDVLLHPEDVSQSVANLIDALKQGLIMKQTVLDAYERIVKFKSTHLQNQTTSPDFVANQQLAEIIIKRSFCVLKDSQRLLPLRTLKDVSVYFFGDAGPYNTEPLRQALKGSYHQRDIALIVVLTSVNAWRGSSGISPEDKEAVLKVIDKHRYSIVVSFGSPYVLRHFAKASTLVACFEPTAQAQESFVNMLKYQEAFTGRLPVKLNLA